MDRPTTRPSKPYTAQEIIRKMRAHFVHNAQPRCVDTNGVCVYTGTGCAVGFMLTEEDAKAIYGGAGGLPRNYPDIYKAYFGEDKIVLQLLIASQLLHDNYRVGFWDTTPLLNFKEHMDAGLAALRTFIESIERITN